MDLPFAHPHPGCIKKIPGTWAERSSQSVQMDISPEHIAYDFDKADGILTGMWFYILYRI